MKDTQKQKPNLDEVKQDAFTRLNHLAKVRRVGDFANSVVRGISDLPYDVSELLLNEFEDVLMKYIGRICEEHSKIE